MLSNVEHVTLRFPEDAVVEISGNPEVVAQIMGRLNGIEIKISKTYFSGGGDE